MSPTERSYAIRAARERLTRKPTPAYCMDCGTQLTWLTFHNVWGEGRIVGRICGACKLAQEVLEAQGANALAQPTLLLTGSPLTAEDRRRWESGKVR